MYQFEQREMWKGTSSCYTRHE